MKTTFWASLAATVLAVGSIPSRAEDIDLFIQPGGSATLPNVLLVLDNTANWSRNVDGQAIFINERLALENTFENLETNADVADVVSGMHGGGEYRLTLFGARGKAVPTAV